MTDERFGLDWKRQTPNNYQQMICRRGHSAAAILLLALLLGCAPQVESQDKYAGNAVIPEPESFVDADFADHNGGTATGDIIHLLGNVISGDGVAQSYAIVYVQQTDAEGRYLAQAEQANAVDPHFQYEGWIRADERGRFTLRTIAPGAYIGSQSQVPHIHVQARSGDKRSYYRTIMFPQYPPRNGYMDYVKRTGKWPLIIDLKESADAGVKYVGDFQLEVF